jgi:hypothetical protein
LDQLSKHPVPCELLELDAVVEPVVVVLLVSVVEVVPVLGPHPEPTT